LHGLNRRLAGITVMTYDQLLAQGERLVKLLGEQEQAAQPSRAEAPPEWDWDPQMDRPSLGLLTKDEEEDEPRF
jgi:hypothetical protein